MNSEIIGIACLGVLIAQLSGIMDKIKWYWYHKILMNSTKRQMYVRSWKPFDCPLCLSFWLGIAWSHFSVQNDIFHTIIYGAACSVLAFFIGQYANRISIQ